MSSATVPRICVIKVWGREIDVVAAYLAEGFEVLPPTLTMTGASMKTLAEVPWNRTITCSNGIQSIGDREAVPVEHGDEFDALPPTSM